MTEKTESIEYLGISWHILAYLSISWHILAYLGIMKVKPGASEQLGWVGPEVRVPTEWYTVRGTGLPINVTFLA